MSNRETEREIKKLTLTVEVPADFAVHLRPLLDMHTDLHHREHICTPRQQTLFSSTRQEKQQCIEFLEYLIKKQREQWQKEADDEFDRRQLDLF